MLQRHNLVWLTDAGWTRAAGILPERDREAAAAWQHAGWPTVVRRRNDSGDPNSVPVGLPLPPDCGGKRRLALTVDQADVAFMREPLSLQEAMSASPIVWSAALQRLHAVCNERHLVVQVYGSLALQALTGSHYLQPGSDIDVLLRPASEAQLAQGMELLAEFSQQLPLDGEVVFPGGQAVAWKEWQKTHASGSGSARVLVKHISSARLALPSDLLSSFLLLDETTPC